MKRRYVRYLCVVAGIVLLFGPFILMNEAVRGSNAVKSMVFLPSAVRIDMATASSAGMFGYGRAATPEEIEAWDIDVRPDGTGLPAGSGTAAEGAVIFEEKCAECHDADGKGGPYAGGRLGTGLIGVYDESEWPSIPLSIGGFWPYAPILFDYINRAQPYSAPGSLEPDEVYSLVAWLLVQNEVIGEDEVMNAETLPAVEMPAKDKFLPYDVRDHYPQ